MGVAFDGINHRRSGFRDPGGGIADGADADVEAEEVLHDVGDPAPGDAVGSGKIGDGGVGLGAEVGLGDLLGQDGLGKMTAIRAPATMGLVFGDHGFDGRDVPDLMPFERVCGRAFFFRGNGSLAVLATVGIVVVDMIHLVRR